MITAIAIRKRPLGKLFYVTLALFVVSFFFAVPVYADYFSGQLAGAYQSLDNSGTSDSYLLLGTADVSSYQSIGQPADIANGVANFTVTYVSETQMDLSWSLAFGAVNIMIRGKYGEYPDDIPNENTTPSDGHLVYYGSATSFSDTSMDFDQNPGALYYKAWGERADGTWFTDADTGWEESEIMTLLALIIFALGTSYVGLKSSYWILKLLAGAAWGLVAVYFVNNPLGGDASQPIQTIVLVVVSALAAAMALMPFWYERQESTGRLRLPFMPTDEQIEERRTTSGMSSMRSRNASHRERVNKALRGDIERKG